MLVNAAGPWVTRFLRDVVGDARAAARPAGEGQPHRGAAALRARPRLHLPERRRAHRLRHPLRARLHADRHHRRGFSRRSRRGASSRRRKSAILRRGQRLPAAAGRSGGHRVALCRACVRCSTTAPSKAHGGDARLRAGRWTRRARRCCRCSAARSRPTGGWPRRRWRSWLGSFPACAAPGRRTPRCRAAIFRGMAVEQVRGDLARRYPFLADAPRRRLVRAYGTLAADMLGDARALADMGRCFGADLTEREIDWLVRTEWARTGRRCALAPQQARTALRCHRDGSLELVERSPRYVLSGSEPRTVNLTDPRGRCYRSSSSNRMRLAAPSRSSYWPERSDRRKHRQTAAAKDQARAEQIQDDIHVVLPCRRSCSPTPAATNSTSPLRQAMA